MRMPAAVERALLVVGATLAVHVPAHAACTQADTFSQVQAAVEAGEFARALELARAEPDRVSALRTEVWLTYRARDFEAAYEACERGLELAPADPWLAERSSAAALWLRDPARTRTSLERFAKILDAAPPAAREPFVELLNQARLAAGELDGKTELARTARSRARFVSLAILGAVLSTMTFVGFKLRTPGRK